ncbi:P-loop NTPase fold protein [Viridibacillus arvi]|uniref:P-loop NTPase fold protein n=1 Tax=Viridibacillus arvi TaxID=263475 RepID=UPI003D02EDA5
MKFLDFTNVMKFLTIYIDLSFPIAIVILLLIIKEAFAYKRSIERVLTNFNKVIYVYFLFTLFSFIVVGLDLIKIAIFFTTLILILEIIHISIYTIKKKNKVAQDLSGSEKSDIPINDKNKLLPTRLLDYKNIKKILKQNNYKEPFALLINGDWGVGKTSLINILMNDLKKEGHHIILIQPLITDNEEKLLDYFYNELRNIFSQNQIYTGQNSAFNNYFEIALQGINTLNSKNLLNIEGLLNYFKEEKPTYRENKESFEIELNKLLNFENKIYIIIDDLDRVEEDTLKKTLIFIKEIVNFKGIDIILLMDEEKIQESKINRKYLEKFINQKYHLLKLKPSEPFVHFLQLIEEGLTINYKKDILNKLISTLPEALKDLNTSFVPKENADKENFEQYKNIFYNNLNNIRNIKKIIREIESSLNILPDSIEFQKNIKKISRLEILILHLAIFKILFPDFYDEMVKINDFEDYLQNKSNPIIKIFFNTLISTKYTEKDILEQIITNDISNFILLKKGIPNYLLAETTIKSNQILKCLDSNKVNDLDIFEVQQVLTYQRDLIDKDLYKVRIEKLIDFIFDTHLNDASHLELDLILRLLNKPQRNIFLKNIHFLNKFKTYLSECTYDNAKSTQTTISLISVLKRAIWLNDLHYLRFIPNLYISRENYRNTDIDKLKKYVEDNTPSFVETMEFLEHITGDKVNTYQEFEQWLNNFISSESENNNLYFEKVIFKTLNTLKEYSKIQIHINNIISDFLNIQEKSRNHNDFSLIIDIDELLEAINDYHIKYKDSKLDEYQSIDNLLILTFQLKKSVQKLETGILNNNFSKLEDLFKNIELPINSEEYTSLYYAILINFSYIREFTK